MRGSEDPSRLPVAAEGAHVSKCVLTAQHWAIFVHFDPFICLYMKGGPHEKTLACLVCATFSVPRMLFFM